ncbi:hypothetical protein M5689_020976 [Euphorbia peplus]|nr:hypothetical protein M5689_020976 [Euphorbia peplus]
MDTSEQLSSTPFEENIDEDNPNLVIPIVSPSETDIAKNEQEVNLFEKKKMKKTSPVWDEFKEVKLSDGTIRFECTHCKAQMAKTKSGATTHFLRHLKCCTVRQIKLRGQKQLSLTTTVLALTRTESPRGG